MVIKKIFNREKDIRKLDKENLSKINSAKEIFVKQKKTSEDENEDSGFNFRDGFNIVWDVAKYELKDSKKTVISSSEEGSDQETLKNPKSKNNKIEEIYSDFTNQSFDKGSKFSILENGEFLASSNVVITDTAGNKIAKPTKKNIKNNSTRGI
jgi:hypothetical protein